MAIRHGGADLYPMVAGLLVSSGNLAIQIACRDADLGVIAPSAISGSRSRFCSDTCCSGDLPDLISICGIVLIIGSGIYTLHREVRRRLAAAARRRLGRRRGGGSRRPRRERREAWAC